MTNSSPKVITKSEARQEFNQFGFVMVLYILLQLILEIGLKVVLKYLPSRLAAGFASEAFKLIGMILICLFTTFVLLPFANRRLEMNIRDYLRVPKLGFKKWVGTIFMGISIGIIATVFSNLALLLIRTNVVEYTSLGYFDSILHVIENLLYFLLFVIIKPICDERIFRGTAQRLLGHYGRYFGIFGSSLLYAICQPDLVHAVPAFVFGWYLAINNLRYHSIEPGIRISMGLGFTFYILDIMPGNLIWLSTLLIMIIFVIAVISLMNGHVSMKIPRYSHTSPAMYGLLLTSSTVLLSIALLILSMVLHFHIV